MYLLLGNEPQALVKVGQRDEVAVDQVNHGLDDAVPLARLYIANLRTLTLTCNKQSAPRGT